MADKNRRGEEPADDNLDENLNEELDNEEEPVSRSGGTATRTRTKAGAEDRPAKAKKETTGKVGVFGRLGRFVREVVGELRKVIWPTRKELLTYTSVVIVFLTFMVSLVGGMDYLFAKVALLVFGN